MKYYIIAGEASGDLHAGNLVRGLQKLDERAELRGWGGDHMEYAGVKLVKHYRDLAFMGFVEVILNLRTIFKNLAFCKLDIKGYKPDVLILVDYPGFNLRIAEWAKRENIKVIYYISPQVWAWKENRVNGIKKNVDKMLVILPFEKQFYQKWNFDVEYVGHPLVQVIEDFKDSQRSNQLTDMLQPGKSQLLIALLPGSRKQEILKKLPIMLEVARHFPAYQFVVAKAPGIEDDFYRALLAPYTNVSSVVNKTYDLLNVAKAALVTSGTATLETALFSVPEVVCYKGSAISYHIAKRLIKIKYISLVNLIMNKEVVRELIQDELTVENLRAALDTLLFNSEKKQQLATDYEALKNLLSKGGNASEHAAQSIFTFMSEK